MPAMSSIMMETSFLWINPYQQANTNSNSQPSSIGLFKVEFGIIKLMICRTGGIYHFGISLLPF
jgi:hypothetical protein